LASSNKRKTTIAKMNRERRLAERRLEKQARKEARKRASEEGHADPAPDTPTDDGEEAGAVDSPL
jgi:hypothetical protein